MGFTEEWHKAIASDPTWQFEQLYDELEEESPELAEAFAEMVRVQSAIDSLAIKRLALEGIYVTVEDLRWAFD